MNAQKIEEKWQKAWSKARIFEAKPSKQKKFFFTVPYPYVSGPLHIGHGRSYTTGDVIARYKRLVGYNVLWPMAFHITGTPILAVADKIKKRDSETLKLYENYINIYERDKNKVKKILNSFSDPANVANYFASKIAQDFKSIGFSIEWKRAFNTGERTYNHFVEWQYKKLNDAGLIKKGEHPITYCMNCKNAVGEDDIEEGDTNKVSINEFTAIKFSFEGGFLLASTLRPETIFGVTNLWINPSAKYVKVNVGNEAWYISKEAAIKLEEQKENVEILKEIGGDYFVGKYATVLDKKAIILPADFVDPDNATGVVYSVPAHAPFDYVALEDIKKDEKTIKKFKLSKKEIQAIKPIQIIDIAGYKDYPAKEICEKLGIKGQKDAQKLEEATKQIYKDEFYEGILNKRCQQFRDVKVSVVKDKVIDFMQQKKMADFFYETSRKAICRCGGKVIVAVLKDQWFLDYSNQGWKEKSKKLLKKMFVFPAKYKQVMFETINWLHERPCARKRGLGTRLPFDQRWIIESLSDSTIYMAFYTVEHIIRNRRIKAEQLTPELFDFIFLNKGDISKVAKQTKISKTTIKDMKSEFEYWYPNDSRHTALPHLSNHLTFFIMHHAAIFPEKYWPGGVTLNELVTCEGAKMSKSKGNVIPLADIARKYGVDLYRLYVISSASLDTVVDWKEKEVNAARRKLNLFVKIAEDSKTKTKIKKKELIDRWLISKFYERLGKYTELMKKYRFREGIVSMFFEFLDDIRYYENRTNKTKRIAIINEILDKWLIVLSPIIPHICEELWSKLGNKSFIAKARWPEVEKAKIDKEVEKAEGVIKGVIDDVGTIIKLIKKKPKKIYLYSIPNETKIYCNAEDFFSREFSAKVKVFANNDAKRYDPQDKASKAKQGKPAIYVE